LTIVTNSNADRFVANPPRNIIFFLVHGSDEGLIRERARGLVNALLGGEADPLRLVRFDGDVLAREPGLLAEEAYAVSMFGGSRLVWIEVKGRDVTAALAPLLKAPPGDCAVVIEAGALKKGSALRAAFEGMNGGASIECYPDGRRELSALIDAEARAAGLRIAPDARNHLISFLGSDRMTTRNEIDKLLLYAAGKDEITIADVEEIISEAAPSALDDALDAAFSGDRAAVETTTGRFFADGGDASALLNAATRRAMMLHRLRLEMDHGRPFEAALRTLDFRMSPMRRSALERQVDRWPAPRVADVLEGLFGHVARARRDSRFAPVIATRALWAVASTGARNAAS
jgi:DNA polymerase-3 subunit delta